MTRGSLVWRTLYGLVIGALLALAVRSIVRNWESLSANEVALHFGPLPVLASGAVILAAFLVLIEAWRGVVTSQRQTLSFGGAARIWSVASLAKYVPGKLWAIAGAAALARQVGVSPWVAAGSALLLQVLALGTGAAIVALSGMTVLEAQYPGVRLGLWLLLAGSTLTILLVLWRPAREWLVAHAPGAQAPSGNGVGDGPSVASIVKATVANGLAWGGYGIALWLLARGILPDVPLGLKAAVGAFTAAYLAGFLALVVPGGIGVREVVFVVLLQGQIGVAPAAALAIASRMVWTVMEVLIAAPFLFRTRKPSASSG